MSCKAIIFDYIGTLVNCKNYSMESSKEKLYTSLLAEGFNVSKERFLEEYNRSHQKYRKVRYEQHKEVTNAIWVAEALQKLGFEVAPDDPRVKAALNVFFQDFVDSLELREGAKKLVKQAKGQCKVALISNFTHAPVIYKSLRKIGISEHFDVVVVSDEVGWRKPCSKIFQTALDKLQIKSCEAVFIGDSPIEDIKGAQDAGLKTVFVPSQFNKLKDLKEGKQTPDHIAKDLQSICQNLNQIIFS
jgi:putative hydrolase of the HAD superfamily